MCGFVSKLPAALLLHPAPLVETRKLGFVEVVKIEKSEVAKLETPGGGLVCSSSRNMFRWFDQPLNTDTRDERK